ncbi:unnamed protein product [Cuscuta campestris]|uniref:Retrotransposon gag domain-containing protein n=1 Tax=Cuscuta campestris TaxID=132261 RepID=A0A484MIW9_9ASTE|nr:unnamed protein product [Cuscuta campestris]
MFVEALLLSFSITSVLYDIKVATLNMEPIPEDAAYDWWKRVSANIPEPVPWVSFDPLLRAEYVPDHYVEAKYEEFSKFTQEKLTLPEYHQQFDGLAEFGKNLVNTMEKRCKRFIKGHFRKDCPTNPGKVFSIAPGTPTAPTVQRTEPAQSHRSTAASQPAEEASTKSAARTSTNSYEFDDILGMDWLSKHQAIVECKERVVKLRADDGNEVIIWGEVLPKAPEFISYMQEKWLICRKCEAFVCTVKDMQRETPNHKDISVVCYFPDVFPEELPGLPPPR